MSMGIGIQRAMVLMKENQREKKREKTRTGGPAYPVVAENGLGHVSEGMTLRDKFASDALIGIISAADAPDQLTTIDYLAQGLRDGSESPALWAANLAYYVADAMLKAREK